ncbi:von Willebrand factor type A domain-containing protein [Puniceibacterium sp. IMCC21224]|uniref:vWA domain-containing protein n=1 Tax=Puniceibacterium sp. IMCC21224 TaxID=1618204 RepID=UPI00350F1F66
MPEPDAHSKARDLAQAMKIFDEAQGSQAAARPTSESTSGMGELFAGVFRMIADFTTRKALVATTSLVAASVALLVVLPFGGEIAPPMRGIAPPHSPPAVRTRERQEAIATPIEAAPSAADTAAPMAELAPPQGFAASAPPAPMVSSKIAPQMGRAIADSAAISAPPMPVPSDTWITPAPDTESFADADPNPIKVTAQDPVSTFSIDVDTASYSIVRSSLMTGRMPPRDAVRIEEMVNYFPYAYPAPDGSEAPFRPAISVVATPWNAGTQLVHIGLQGQMPAVTERAPLNLVFLIDTSGSMQDATKLPLLIQSFRLMLAQLHPEDQIAIVTYAGSAGLALEPTPASERDRINTALEQLSAGGSTAGQAGLQQAYAIAQDMTKDGEVSRVILATDGDFNVGLADPEALKTYIADKRDSGTYLSVLGFGRGNLDDATMQALAQNGDGRAAYIDTLNEARKVLVDELSGALFPIADDVKIQVEFNPAVIAEYRLIGYETRALLREDFANDRVDAGEIGAGHAVTALYEITPVGSSAVLNAPLRYGETITASGDQSELGFLRLRYKAPGATASQLIETPIPNVQAEASEDTRFATAIAGFGQILRGDSHIGDWSYNDAANLATQSRGDDPFGYRAEAISLMRLAASLDQSD